MINLCFFGADIFAVPILEELLQSRSCNVKLIITRPAKPAGRGLKPEPNPILSISCEKKVPTILVDENHDWAIANERISAINPDYCVVAALGRIIPSSTLRLCPNRFINIHPSLLPKYRGPSPIESVILDGEKNTGLSYIILNQKLDAGPIIAQEKIEVGSLNATELSQKLTLHAKNNILAILKDLHSKKLIIRKQNESQATYTRIITKKDGHISLNDYPSIIEKKVRAYSPWPGVSFLLNNATFKIITSHIKKDQLVIDEIQPANKKIMTGREFINGYRPMLTKLPKSIIINPL